MAFAEISTEGGGSMNDRIASVSGRDLLRQYAVNYPNATDAEKNAYARIVSRLCGADFGRAVEPKAARLLQQQEKRLSAARVKANKGKLIRALLAERENDLARCEEENTRSRGNERATNESREAEAALQTVLRSVRSARASAADARVRPAAVKRSIDFSDEDYVAAMEKTIRRLNRNHRHEAAARLRFAYVRQQQSFFDLGSEKEVVEQFNPDVNNAFVCQNIASKAARAYRPDDPSMRALDEMLRRESNLYDEKMSEQEKRDAERKRSVRIERHRLERQRNLLKKQELDLRWAEYDMNIIGIRPWIDKDLTLDATMAVAKDYVELLKESARSASDERQFKELCLRAAIVKTQCAPDEIVDTRENRRICGSISSWAEYRADMSVEEYVTASEAVVTEELERLEIIVSEELQIQPAAPQAVRENDAPQQTL